MGYLEQFKVEEIKGKLTTDLSYLGKLYKVKKSKYITRNIEHSLLDDFIKKGWEVEGKPMATKTKIRKQKEHSKQFEDDIWCQFYELGFRHLNYDENLHLPFSSNEEDTKQIDVVAINHEAVFLIECKSSDKPKKITFKDEFELLSLRLNGFRKVIEQAYGKGLRVKYIFATRNLKIDYNDIDFQRLLKTNSFYYNDNTYDYINNLIKSYKKASLYQFFGLVFKNELINTEKIELPAVEGKMGKKTYYMFSIEPEMLLKLSFILHRTRANEAEFPTYQRLLVPTRLKGITKFIDDGGFFPNSLIVNFSHQNKHKLIFEASSRTENSLSKIGILKIPNAYAIAYIIDGQHRLYGYANSKFLSTNTIPVVAFDNLDSKEQLDIFMDINQNQKAVSPSLRTDLEEDLFWESPRADMRIKALRSSIVKGLSNDPNSPLYKKITVGEDKAVLSMENMKLGLIDSGLLPIAKGNSFDESSVYYCVYNTHNHEHNIEMKKAKKEITEFLKLCYECVQEKFPVIFNKERFFIISNRGSFAYISVIGSLHRYMIDSKILNKNSTPTERYTAIEKYLIALLEKLSSLNQEVAQKQLDIQGKSAEKKWLTFFQSLINEKYPEYSPSELTDWKERQDENLQDEGGVYIKSVERRIKTSVLDKLKSLYNEDWELEINTIKTTCQGRANAENEKNYKEGIKDRVDWMEMFTINDYKKIIDDNWGKTPKENSNFIKFSDEFSIDIGEGINNRKDALKWMSHFNSYRNTWAHEGTKNKGLNKDEILFLKKVYNHFFNA
ncbi:DGQHR domain-containing protein [Flavobacterium sp. N2820]|uniref:DGQHR domain-containing protein n=1 Tax=Flavobacterium sp. N2820 TaxID=2986834 RepID=UPI0022253619|nr:DGQHR domain-containing protein [Flavobacterium sp. N2820]